MKRRKTRRKAQKNSVTKNVLHALLETSWVTATNLLAGVVTLSIHAKRRCLSEASAFSVRGRELAYDPDAG